jgi:hypothetical protein
LHSIIVKAHIEEPDWDSWKLYCKWINYTYTIWVTIPEDIAGSYHLHPNVIAPDFEVDIEDIATAAWAFGSYPGHRRWSPIADLIGDYFIDIQDIASIAFWFGWTGQ